jgi:hypothetical protein
MLDVNAQVDAAYRVLLDAPAPKVHVTDDGRLVVVWPDLHPTAVKTAAAVLRSVVEQYPTGGVIPLGTLRHMADEIEEDGP